MAGNKIARAQNDAELKQVVIDSIKDTLKGFQSSPQVGASEYLAQRRDSSSVDFTRFADVVDGLQRQVNDVTQQLGGLTSGARFPGASRGCQNNYFPGQGRGFPSSGLIFISQTDHLVLTVFLIVVPEQTWEKSFVYDVDGLVILLETVLLFRIPGCPHLFHGHHLGLIRIFKGAWVIVLCVEVGLHHLMALRHVQDHKNMIP